MRSNLIASIALGLVLAVSSSASAQTFKTVKTAWGKALRSGKTVKSVDGVRLAGLGLNAAARANVKASLKGETFYGPVGKSTYTLTGKGKVARGTFAIFINAPGPDTNSSDFIAKNITKVFNRSTGQLVATHNLTWDGERTLVNAWTK
jgi:hypothetical protein